MFVLSEFVLIKRFFILLVVIFSYTLICNADNEFPDIEYTVHIDRTLYSKPGYNYSRYVTEQKSGSKTLPDKKWVTPGMHLNLLEVKKAKDGKMYAYMQDNENKNNKGWLEYTHLHYFENGVRIQCDPSVNQIKTIEEIIAHIENKEYKSPKLTKVQSIKLGRKCYDFIDKRGNYGKRGKLLAREILGKGRSTNRWEYFKQSTSSILSFCPKFDNFNDEEKLNFWIWTFAAISQTEGTCKENVSTPNATHGLAVSDFQLPEEWKGGRSWRGPGCEASGKAPSYNDTGKIFNGNFLMANPHNSIPCAVEIMSGSLCGFYSYKKWPLSCDPVKNTKGLTGKHQYWERLRKSEEDLDEEEKTIVNMVKEFPLCK